MKSNSEKPQNPFLVKNYNIDSNIIILKLLYKGPDLLLYN